MDNTNDSSTKFILSDNLYSWGKKLVQVILPALSSLYFGLASIWDLPAKAQVVGTFAVVATFFGVVLGISSVQYDKSGAAYDGKMVVLPPEEPGEPHTYSLEVDKPLEDLPHQKKITFKVHPLPTVLSIQNGSEIERRKPIPRSRR